MIFIGHNFHAAEVGALWCQSKYYYVANTFPFLCFALHGCMQRCELKNDDDDHHHIIIMGNVITSCSTRNEQTIR